MKAEVDKLDVNKLVPTILNNLKTKLDELDVGELKTIPIALKRISDAVKIEVAKNTKLNTLKWRVNKLNKKFFDTTTLIDINQYNADKQN